jgi:lysophospholipase L1-like esterase
MYMGNSITAADGYRSTLEHKLDSAGHTFSSRTWATPGWQISHTNEEINGHTYVSLQSVCGSGGCVRDGLYDDIAQAITPDYFSTAAGVHNYLLLMIGTNDFLHQVVRSSYGTAGGDANNDATGEGQEYMAESALERLRPLLHRIDEQCGVHGLSLTVLLATIPTIEKRYGEDAVSDTTQQEVAAYNAAILHMDTLPFSCVRLCIVDQNEATRGKLQDGVHPTADGYQAMARYWYAAITTQISTRISTPLPPGDAGTGAAPDHRPTALHPHAGYSFTLQGRRMQSLPRNGARVYMSRGRSCLHIPDLIPGSTP